MAENSVDDQFQGCEKEMEGLVAKKHQAELSGNLESAWRKGKDWWNTEKITKNTHHLEGGNYYIALYVYTDYETKIYSMFNQATRSGKNDYRKNRYQWYSLQFLLTRAVQVLKESERQKGIKCISTYRGTSTQFNKDVLNKEIRFGSFTSSSLKKSEALKFGNVSCFEIYTCNGAAISEYSAYPAQEEVLIPPYETFKVSQIDLASPGRWCRAVYVLKSTGTKSDLNCAVAPSLIDYWYHGDL